MFLLTISTEVDSKKLTISCFLKHDDSGTYLTYLAITIFRYTLLFHAREFVAHL
jgi:hypothetical protein